MPEMILEIGPGGQPAVNSPGPAFDAGTRYYAVEPLLRDRATCGADVMAFEDSDLILADSAALPFKDETFSDVISRSVFGEYTMDADRTGSNLENTYSGLYEAFRVLRPDGQIVIAEENTPRPPATPLQIGGVLLDAGFADVRVYPCQDMQNPHWREARGAYWRLPRTEDRLSRDRPIDTKWGYVITAERPVAELETTSQQIGLNGIWRANMQRGWGHPDNRPMTAQADFKYAKKPATDGKRPDWRSQLTVVAADTGPVDYSAYEAAVRAGTTKSLFLD
jgi:SAM-dependent methyltransferase